MTAPLCTCGHERDEHSVIGMYPGECEECDRCRCTRYAPRPDALSTVSFTDLPVSQGARDLMHEVDRNHLSAYAVLDILAAADPKDVRSLLWARRAGKL